MINTHLLGTYKSNMFLVQYSSSSGSEDEKASTEVKLKMLSVTRKDSSTTEKITQLPQASSLLGKRKHNLVDDGVIDDPSKHDGRIRSFKHERGNWATYVYVPVNISLLEDLQDICRLHLENRIKYKFSDEIHISLTKTVVLQYHFIQSFVDALQTALQPLERFTVSFNNLKAYTNSEQTRTFLALKIDNLYMEKMLNILQKVNSVMQDFKLELFYENPSFHISILWCTGNCVNLLEALVPIILESVKERLVLCFKIDKICCRSGFKEFNFTLKNK